MKGKTMAFFSLCVDNVSALALRGVERARVVIEPA